MAAICKMKLTPEVCLRCGRTAWAPFPLCFTWKRLCFLLTLVSFLSASRGKAKRLCFLRLFSLLNVEKTKDNDFSDLTLLLSSLHEIEKPN